MSPRKLSMVAHLSGPVGAGIAIQFITQTSWSPVYASLAAIGAALLFIIVIPTLISELYIKWYYRRRTKP
jgi:hypothetical protein